MMDLPCDQLLFSWRSELSMWCTKVFRSEVNCVAIFRQLRPFGENGWRSLF